MTARRLKSKPNSLTYKQIHATTRSLKLSHFVFTPVYNEFYYAYTGRLPEVYLEKRVAADHFDYGEDLMLLCQALDMVNSQLSPVKAFLAEEDSTVVFRLCLDPKTAGQFKEELPKHLDRLEQSVSEMGQACELAVRRSRMQGADDLMESLMNPAPNNPLLLGKKVS